MVDSLLDSSILIDELRKYPPSVSWLKTLSNPGVVGVVWLELIEGARDKVAQQRAVRVLNRFERVPIEAVDENWAIKQLLHFRLSHNIGMNDCLIAAVSARLNLPLYTTNLKHFTPLIGPLARKPY